jgi:hypothetical protein
MWRTTEGSTGRLIQLCIGYFVFYVITGITVKYFLSHGMEGMEFLVYSTAGGSLIVFPVVVGLKWYRLASNRTVRFAGLDVPSELAYIIPSGICTAVVIPTTTLMYTLPITVMVAMTMMRGSVIVISRVVDAIQIRQGILDKKVYLEENLAVASALAGVGVHIFYGAREKGGFDFVGDTAAMTIFISYIASYALRIYLMNYFKNTRGKGIKLDNKGFFALEQFAATATLVLGTAAVLVLVHGEERVELVRGAITNPIDGWGWATLAGTAFGAAAFFSVFLFMFKGRTATFAGLVNRLTSLIAGTTATIGSWLFFSGRRPSPQDWEALAFILIAVALLAKAERKRAAELAARGEIAEVRDRRNAPGDQHRPR